MASTSGARICDLPNEMLLSIFSFLPVADLARCAATCELWHGLVAGYSHPWRGKAYRSARSPAECAEMRSVLHALPPFPEVTIQPADHFEVEITYPKLLLSVRYVRVLKDWLTLKCEYLSTRLDFAGDILYYRTIVDLERLRRLRIRRILPSESWAMPIYSADYIVQAALSTCPGLRRLSVCADFVSADYLEGVAALGRLRALELESPQLHRLSFLRHCAAALEELALAGCAGLPSRELPQLRRLRQLRALRLADLRFEERDLAAALSALAALEALRLDRCSCLRDLAALRHCARLRRLRVTCSAGDEPQADAERQPQLRLHELRLPTDADDRGAPFARAALSAVDLPTALSRLRRLGLRSSCVAYLAPLRHCPRVREICCEFVRGLDGPAQHNVRLHVTLTGPV